MRNLVPLLACAFATFASAQLAETPKANDDRLKIELFAAAPDIVTPIAIDVDDKGRVYVIESHTHQPLANYQAPRGDRIRIYEDLDGDRRADRITNFHTGETHLMSIRLYRVGSPGTLYAATRREVFRLRDANGDGVADERTSIVKLETKGNYPHNGLAGVTFDFKGDLYFGFGENLGEDYKLIGSDGTTLTGGGEGGNIYTCDKDGRKLRRVATGFWNPFDMCFDAFGRLFAVDNDPDSRPPCRLLHIVEGGDYGYRFRYGRKGLHPFTSWNGEIPGTLPMVAGTGEAPSGMLAYESDNLPDDYLGNLLVTSWGDHRIERYRLKPHGASFTSKMEPVFTGGDNFRPVGIALAPDGSLFVSDWVDKSYNVHGKGRIWRISAKEEKKGERPDAKTAAALRSAHLPLRYEAARLLLNVGDPGKDQLAALLGESNHRLEALGLLALSADGVMRASDRVVAARISSLDAGPLAAMVVGRHAGIRGFQGLPDHFTQKSVPYMIPWLRHAPIDPNADFNYIFLTAADPFVQHEAIRRFSSPTLRRFLSEFDLSHAMRRIMHADEERGILFPARIELGLLLAQRAAGIQSDPYIKFLFDSEHSDVRFAVTQWVAEEKLEKYRKQLEDALGRSDLMPRELVATLAALDMLDGGKPQSADHVGGRWYLERMAFGEKTPMKTRAMALRTLPADNPALTLEALTKLLAAEDASFKLEVVRTLRQSPHAGKAGMLLDLARDSAASAELRAEAIAGLDAANDDAKALLLGLAVGKDRALAAEALRSLRGASLDERQRANIAVLAAEVAEVTEAAARVLDVGYLMKRPAGADVAGWVELAAVAGATPQAAGEAKARGERLFFSAKGAACFRCHTVGGRGGETGPDLSVVGKFQTREWIVESIVQPGAEIAPRYAAHLVTLADGSKLTLMYVGQSPDGRQMWCDTNGKTLQIEPAEIEAKESLKTSIMPDGLAATLTKQEWRDLIAYLESLRGE